jgi:O-antigen/teichoic acid export membrane protein
LSLRKLRPEEDYDAYVNRVAQGVGVSSGGQGVGRFLGYATHAALAWMHGPALLVFAPLALAAFFVLLVSFGLGPSDRRFLASFRDVLRRKAAR